MIATRHRAAATVLVAAVWLALLAVDDRWSVLSFVVYGLCFTIVRQRPLVGVGVAAAVSTLWTVITIAGDSPLWTAAIPLGVLIAGSGLSLMISRLGRMNEEQALLIMRLQATRAELAESERAKGTLEEHARLAGEIHDTLAQGFTSIVLLSRALRRAGTTDQRLDTIEEVAQQNLDAARRLVASDRPAELDAASLPMAVERHVATAVTEPTTAAFRVIGTPRPLPGGHEVVMLRAVQETLTNTLTHADAQAIEVTLSYLEGVVALDVRDDGVGFRPGRVADRGTLTGGQGLDVLRTRAGSLGGEMTIESAPGEGTVISVVLPDEAAPTPGAP